MKKLIVYILLLFSFVAQAQDGIPFYKKVDFNKGFSTDGSLYIDSIVAGDANSIVFYSGGNSFKAYIFVPLDSTWVTGEFEDLTVNDEFHIGDSTFTAEDFDFLKILDTISPSLYYFTDTLQAGIDDTISNPFQDGVIPVGIYIQDSEGNKIEGVVSIINNVTGDIILYSDTEYISCRVTLFGSSYTGNYRGVEYYGGEGIDINQNINTISIDDSTYSLISKNADSILSLISTTNGMQLEYLDSIIDLRNSINSNVADISYIDDSITNLRTDIESNSIRIDTNRTEYLDLIVDLGLEILNNTTDIASIEDSISDLRTDIQTNVTTIGTNRTEMLDSVSDLRSDIQTNVTTIWTNRTEMLDSVSNLRADIQSNVASLNSIIGTKYIIDTYYDKETLTINQDLSNPLYRNVFLSKNGEYLFVSNFDSLYRYDLSINYDISTAILSESILANRISSDISYDGNYLISSNAANGVYRIDSLHVPYSINSITYNVYQAPSVEKGRNARFDTSGYYYYMIITSFVSSDSVCICELNSKYDISISSRQCFKSSATDLKGIYMSDDGNNLFTLNYASGIVYHYYLPNKFNFDNKYLLNTYTLPYQYNSIFDFDKSAYKFYINTTENIITEKSIIP